MSDTKIGPGSSGKKTNNKAELEATKKNENKKIPTHNYFRRVIDLGSSYISGHVKQVFSPFERCGNTCMSYGGAFVNHLFNVPEKYGFIMNTPAGKLWEKHVVKNERPYYGEIFKRSVATLEGVFKFSLGVYGGAYLGGLLGAYLNHLGGYMNLDCIMSLTGKLYMCGSHGWLPSNKSKESYKKMAFTVTMIFAANVIANAVVKVLTSRFSLAVGPLGIALVCADLADRLGRLVYEGQFRPVATILALSSIIGATSWMRNTLDHTFLQKSSTAIADGFTSNWFAVAVEHSAGAYITRAFGWWPAGLIVSIFPYFFDMNGFGFEKSVMGTTPEGARTVAIKKKKEKIE